MKYKIITWMSHMSTLYSLSNKPRVKNKKTKMIFFEPHSLHFYPHSL